MGGGPGAEAGRTQTRTSAALDDNRPLQHLDMQTSARNVLAAAAVLALASGAAAQEGNVFTNMADSVATGMTAFFENISSMFTNAATSFA